jgi:CRP-like cAMP-binding protein
LSDGSFFGEGSLAGQPLRMGTATPLTDCAVLRIEKRPWWTRFTGNTPFPICSSHIC